MSAQQSGFTLLELLVVLVIVGILTAIAIPQYDAYKRRAFDTRARSDLYSAALAEEAFFLDEEKYLSCSGSDCTKLRDPNQWFGSIETAGSIDSPEGGDVAGHAGNGGSSSAGAGGVGVGGTTNGVAGARVIADAGDAGATNATCNDETGFHGRGCSRCAPIDLESLENACTSATCTPFDDALRLTKLGKDGALPALPAVSSADNGGAGGSAAATPAGGTSGAGGTAGSSAGAGKSCSDLALRGTIVYVTGSSAAKPFLQQIAQQLAAQNVFIVYESTGSCVGVDAVLNGTAMTTGPKAAALSATYWDSAVSSGSACDLPLDGVQADIGVSDVFAQSCAGFELANLDALQIRDAHGPIQTMTFAVPVNSEHWEISARAAYFAFGFGADGGILNPAGDRPIWSDEAYLFKRSASSGTQAMLAAAIGVPAAAWRGKAHKASDDIAADLQAAGQKQDTANAALGILAADYIDTKNLRAQIRVLAFQDSAQHCAVFPDSTSDAREKRNVRDGHYPIWGPLHLLLRIDAQGRPLNPENRQAVTDIVGYLSGTKALPNGVQLIKVYAQSGLVPECAMHVSRAKDGGNILPYEPTNPCSCLFDQLTGSTSCTPCRVQGECKTGETCSQGYCEGARL